MPTEMYIPKIYILSGRPGDLKQAMAVISEGIAETLQKDGITIFVKVSKKENETSLRQVALGFHLQMREVRIPAKPRSPKSAVVVIRHEAVLPDAPAVRRRYRFEGAAESLLVHARNPKAPLPSAFQ